MVGGEGVELAEWWMEGSGRPEWWGIRGRAQWWEVRVEMSKGKRGRGLA